MSRAVLDSSAILAVLLKEPGQAVVADYRGDALVSAINLAEVAAKFADRGASPSTEWLYPFSLMRLEVVAFDEDQALAIRFSPRIHTAMGTFPRRPGLFAVGGAAGGAGGDGGSGVGGVGRWG